jgi:hypothetical protein
MPGSQLVAEHEDPMEGRNSGPIPINEVVKRPTADGSDRGIAFAAMLACWAYGTVASA